jgi:hypothetical protein
MITRLHDLDTHYILLYTEHGEELAPSLNIRVKSNTRIISRLVSP